MTRLVPLHRVAHARAGDKGNCSNVSLCVYDASDFPAVKAQITSSKLKTTFPELLKGEVQRYELDHLLCLNFVMDQALEGGVNESLNLDAHGKSWSFLILSLDVDLDDQ